MNAVVSVFLGSIFPRVLYTCLAPLMIWAAMGLWVLLATLRAWFDSLKLKIAVPVFMLLLAGIVFFDYHIFSLFEVTLIFTSIWGLWLVLACATRLRNLPYALHFLLACAWCFAGCVRAGLVVT